MPKPNLTQDALKAVLSYDPESGVFTWLPRPGSHKAFTTKFAGKAAGYRWPARGGHTYIVIEVMDWPFLAHRLAFLYMTGNWPPAVVDHADRDGTNNKWENLRNASVAQNLANSRRPVTNTTGFKGVSLYKPNGKYRATIREDGKLRSLGYYDTPEDAHAAYVAAAISKSGEFSRAS